MASIEPIEVPCEWYVLDTSRPTTRLEKVQEQVLQALTAQLNTPLGVVSRIVGPDENGDMVVEVTVGLQAPIVYVPRSGEELDLEARHVFGIERLPGRDRRAASRSLPARRPLGRDRARRAKGPQVPRRVPVRDRGRRV